MKKFFLIVHVFLIIGLVFGFTGAAADNLQVRVAGLPDNVTLRMRSAPVDGATIGRTWNGSQFEVIDTAVDGQGREWYYVGAWVASWYTEPVIPSDSPYLTANLALDTRWAVLMTDNVSGEAVPRMLQNDWTWNASNPAVSYPETVRFTNQSGSKYPAQAIDDEIMNYVIELNAMNHPNAVDILLNPGSGWINQVHPEFLLTAGAWVVVAEETPSAIRVKTLPWDWAPDDPGEFNHRTAAPFIHHFIAIHENGYRVDISSGGDGSAESILTPVLCPGEAWIQKRDKWADVRYWFPPEPPFDVEITSISGLSLRRLPMVSSETLLDVLPYETVVTVYGYYPTDSGVWALVDGGYIALQYLSYPGDRSPWYGTDWVPDELAWATPRPTYDY